MNIHEGKGLFVPEGVCAGTNVAENVSVTAEHGLQQVKQYLYLPGIKHKTLDFTKIYVHL